MTEYLALCFCVYVEKLSFKMNSFHKYIQKYIHLPDPGVKDVRSYQWGYQNDASGVVPVVFIVITGHVSSLFLVFLLPIWSR